MVERARDPIDSMDHEHRRFTLAAPIDDVNAQTVYVDEAVERLRNRRALIAERDRHTQRRKRHE
jgi:hypothetical protein